MRFEGRLDKWNDDRGFGFITPTRGGEPVFVHISAFARDGRRPQLGEALTFEVEPAGDGKKRAIRVERSGSAPRPRAPAGPSGTSAQPRRPVRQRSLAGTSITVLLLAGIGAFAYVKVNAPRFGAASSAPDVSVSPAQPAAISAFRCDGRTHCSQMTSCAEATFFLKNCPGTQMDGDGDGIPCEQQWCN